MNVPTFLLQPRISVYDECYPRLSDISAGGSAVIVGSYIPTDPATDGIMIGYYQTKKNFHVFSEYKVTGVEVIFNITVTNFLFSIATKDKRVLLNDDLVSDGWYSLIVQNINIKNMEIVRNLQCLSTVGYNLRKKKFSPVSTATEVSDIYGEQIREEGSRRQKNEVKRWATLRYMRRRNEVDEVTQSSPRTRGPGTIDA
ncbi:hypothetical protein HPB51_028775 [Rhipicephalus microplus]|uniref:Uncharacterized protein n=1 Tax=Rhipicephalus microplus TaxID=6941 RepID=A0A9J6CWX6_RHIMP|nr:hypothetical protein HPB51_028775 [Rhipicephalus microplus]